MTDDESREWWREVKAQRRGAGQAAADRRVVEASTQAKRDAAREKLWTDKVGRPAKRVVRGQPVDWRKGRLF